MILAGGTGAGLSVLTRHRAKTALPFGGKYRIIDFCLSNCINSDITDIYILAQYNPKSLIEHIRMGKPWDLDRKSGGVTILQPTFYGEAAHWYRGTGDAIYQNIDIIRDSGCEHVLVLSGDQVYLADYGRMVAFHLSHPGPVTIACRKVGARESSRFGMVACSGDGRVTRFREKPKKSGLDMASMGIYMFDREFLVRKFRKERTDLVFDLLMPVIDSGKVYSYEMTGYWEDIGSIPSYYRASMGMLRKRNILFDTERPVFTRGGDLPPAIFQDGSFVSNSIVAYGCRIEGRVENSILFPGVAVERDAQVTGSVVFSSARIGEGARVERTIMDKDVRAGAGSHTGSAEAPLTGELVECSDPESSGLARKITVIGKGTLIQSGSSVPAGLAVEPGSRVRREGR